MAETTMPKGALTVLPADDGAAEKKAPVVAEVYTADHFRRVMLPCVRSLQPVIDEWLLDQTLEVEARVGRFRAALAVSQTPAEEERAKAALLRSWDSAGLTAVEFDKLHQWVQKQVATQDQWTVSEKKQQSKTVDAFLADGTRYTFDSMAAFEQGLPPVAILRKSTRGQYTNYCPEHADFGFRVSAKTERSVPVPDGVPIINNFAMVRVKQRMTYTHQKMFEYSFTKVWAGNESFWRQAQAGDCRYEVEIELLHLPFAYAAVAEESARTGVTLACNLILRALELLDMLHPPTILPSQHRPLLVLSSSAN